jgi:hypothetical protein
MLDHVLGHSEGEAVDKVRSIPPHNRLLPWLLPNIGDDVPHLLDPVTQEIDAGLVVEAVGRHPHIVRPGLEVLAEGLNVDVLLEVEVVDPPALLGETLRPLRSVDELHPQLVELPSLKPNYPHEKTPRLQRTGDGLPHCLDIVHPMQRAETYHCVELLHVVELSV